LLLRRQCVLSRILRLRETAGLDPPQYVASRFLYTILIATRATGCIIQQLQLREVFSLRRVSEGQYSNPELHNYK
jgi:hypothetical protein